LILLALGFNEKFYGESSTVRSIFKFVTYFGEPIIFVILIAIIFITYDKNFAKRLTLSLLFTYYISDTIKEIFQDSRPDTNSDGSDLIESSYGFPSGHALNSVGFWGYFAYEWKDKPKSLRIQFIPAIFSVIILLVAVSRVVIGTHDLQDIIGGLLIGIGLLLLYIYLEPTLAAKFTELNFSIKMILAVLIPIILFIIPTLLFPAAGVELVEPDPPLYSDNGAFGLVGGTLFGLSMGYILENEYINYDPRTLKTKQKIINVIIGLIILLAIFLPLEYLLEIDSVFYRFARYAILAFVLTFLLPLLFKKINK
jgi:membrane-associated phospholipid phosphatase